MRPPAPKRNLDSSSLRIVRKLGPLCHLAELVLSELVDFGPERDLVGAGKLGSGVARVAVDPVEGVDQDRAKLADRRGQEGRRSEIIHHG
jgi:hypothetical protein